jgi:CheY-like chemotaxis protein
VLELYAFRVEDETQRRIAVIFTDVTNRKRTEQALREADRAKDEFLAVLGHELRNPLAPLRAGLDLLEHARRKPELIDSLRPMMGRQLSHLVRLVDDLLDISRISRGKITLQRTPLDLNAPIEAALEQLRSVMSERRHELLVQLSDVPLPVEGDFERLTQVVANLLGNAAKYTEPAGKICVTSEVENGQAVVRVRDTGYGIPPDRFDRLFQLFSQIPEHHAQTGGGGLGIGLALSRQLVDLHRGSIEVHSDGFGHGSEFIVRLPMSHAATDAAPVGQPGATSVPARRVLVVDDNVDAAEGLRMLLELQGHVVQAVQDGPSALRQMERFDPEIVLLDLGLPGMDGIEVGRRVRAMPGRDSALLIAVTGWGKDEDKERTEAAGFDDHLTKPIDLDDVSSILARVPESG